ncbi:DUF4387 family protein [Sulfitobacter sp. LCG007]
MPELGTIVEKVRSKNAGPFWLTIDIFCGTPDAYRRVAASLGTAQVAEVLGTPAQLVKRFDIEDLSVVKFSLPRPAIQGTAGDRDMHGAAWAPLLAEIVLPD